MNMRQANLVVDVTLDAWSIRLDYNHTENSAQLPVDGDKEYRSVRSESWAVLTAKKVTVQNDSLDPVRFVPAWLVYTCESKH